MTALTAQHVQSQFPINVASIMENPDARRIENLIAAYKEMGLGDASESSQRGDTP